MKKLFENQLLYIGWSRQLHFLMDIQTIREYFHHELCCPMINSRLIFV